jgi:hypothetical protein
MERKVSFGNVIWVMGLLAGLAALGSFVIYPFILNMKMRSLAAELVNQTLREADPPPYQPNLESATTQEAVKAGKHLIPHITVMLTHEHHAVRLKGIHVVDKICGSTFGYEFNATRDNWESTVKAVEQWYLMNKDNPTVK